MELNEPTRRRALEWIGAALAAVAWTPRAGATDAAPASFPTRPIKLWVPWPPGGATDLTLRMLAEGAGQRLGQRIVVDNRAGAGGTLVMPVLAKSAPDGYTIGQMPQTVFRAPWTQDVGWDPIRDTTPIIQISGVTFGILVPAGSAIRSVEELFDWARRHPGELTLATNGVGTTPHVVMERLFRERGIGWIHVPFKGTAEQMVAVTSGLVMAGVNASGFAPFVDSGQLRLLATLGAERPRRWPQVPTLRELGYGVVATSAYGIAGPAGMPGAVVRILHDAFKAAMHESGYIAELAKHDQMLDYLGPEDYGRAMRAAYAAEREAVERQGLGRRE